MSFRLLPNTFAVQLSAAESPLSVATASRWDAGTVAPTNYTAGPLLDGYGQANHAVNSVITRGVFDPRLEGRTMRREELFSKNGFYQFVVENNVICHHEAMVKGIESLDRWLSERNQTTPIRVLDLACGGLPITISGIMKRFSDQQFEYTGVDINPDQVELVNDHFEFSENVKSVRVFEGDAWNLDESITNSDFDIVFTGMNLHHGTPEELYYLACQLFQLLPEGALIINHDEYRPDELPYLRRPSANPNKPSESYVLIPPFKLFGITAADLGIHEYAVSAQTPDWRKDMNQRLLARLTDLGASDQDLQDHEDHVMNRDYPVSKEDMVKIFTNAGFIVTVHDLSETGHPLGNYFSAVEIRKPYRG